MWGCKYEQWDEMGARRLERRKIFPWGISLSIKLCAAISQEIMITRLERHALRSHSKPRVRKCTHKVIILAP
jgi:hypothetical protein